jgi:hypothetical protein
VNCTAAAEAPWLTAVAPDGLPVDWLRFEIHRAEDGTERVVLEFVAEVDVSAWPDAAPGNVG